MNLIYLFSTDDDDDAVGSLIDKVIENFGPNTSFDDSLLEQNTKRLDNLYAHC